MLWGRPLDDNGAIEFSYRETEKFYFVTTYPRHVAFIKRWTDRIHATINRWCEKRKIHKSFDETVEDYKRKTSGTDAA